jgi:hypothetical protein
LTMAILVVCEDTHYKRRRITPFHEKVQKVRTDTAPALSANKGRASTPPA